jgi:hypothetical protein
MDQSIVNGTKKTFKEHIVNWGWGHTHAIPALRRQRYEDGALKVNLVYIGKPV